jgi:hypothetical protein
VLKGQAMTAAQKLRQFEGERAGKVEYVDLANDELKTHDAKIAQQRAVVDAERRANEVAQLFKLVDEYRAMLTFADANRVAPDKGELRRMTSAFRSAGWLGNSDASVMKFYELKLAGRQRRAWISLLDMVHVPKREAA